MVRFLAKQIIQKIGFLNKQVTQNQKLWSSTSHALLNNTDISHSQDISSRSPTLSQGIPAINTSEDFFRINDLFSLEDLMRARVYFGHKEGMLNGHMRPFIFGKRLGVLIIDLKHTERLLKKALTVTAEIAYRNGIILFVHNSRQTGYMVEDAAKECGEYAYCRKWRDQIFTNSTKIFDAVTRLPDLVIMFNTTGLKDRTHHAVQMSAKMLIPTVGICDTNSDPTLITYPVPGNDDSPESIELYCKLFKTAILNGKEKKKEILEKFGEDIYYRSLEYPS